MELLEFITELQMLSEEERSVPKGKLKELADKILKAPKEKLQVYYQEALKKAKKLGGSVQDAVRSTYKEVKQGKVSKKSAFILASVLVLGYGAKKGYDMISGEGVGESWTLTEAEQVPSLPKAVKDLGKAFRAEATKVVKFFKKEYGKAMGVNPKEALARALRAIKDAKLDVEITSKSIEDQIKQLKRELKEVSKIKDKTFKKQRIASIKKKLSYQKNRLAELKTNLKSLDLIEKQIEKLMKVGEKVDKKKVAIVSATAATILFILAKLRKDEE